MGTKPLREIQGFADLLVYLEEKLDWPLQGYSLEDAAFSYEPEELGLKDDDAAHIKAIHQLRPLTSGQPWGIFFVEFEKKKLPVVVLRRILSHLAIKKRASANKSRAPAWHAEDLLFITAYGEDAVESREIAFAHFHQNPGDMPTLHVLGWDGGDTPLKLAKMDTVLQERLHWPADEDDSKAWRENWSKPFRHKIGHVIRTADLLAVELARLARGIRDKAQRMLAAESDKGPITKLYKAFQTALIHDLTPESFADTYAQTITYGLLTAAISRTEMSEGRHGTALIAENVVDMVPVTNPFLKEMLQTFLKIGGRKGGIDFDELGIQDVVELLRGDETDLPAILRDFGNKTRGEDPVIHFYEHFLSAYNKQLKIQRGVFYTPQPVVSYIVRSVHELLQTEFGLADGLADTTTWGEMLKKHPDLKLPLLTDEPGEKRTISPAEPFVQILDPATGTATFLVEVIDVIYRSLSAKWNKQHLTDTQQRDAWNDYVPQHLLPRLHAYELMMAPYAIAHMKIGLKLAETGYRFGTEERARIYLTNALEPWHRQLKLPDFEALAHEATAVNEIKRGKRFTVVIGNPPYSGHSSNNGEWISSLIHDYHFVDGVPLGERNPKWLQDDYVKFIRFAQQIISKSPVGVLGYITNHSYCDNPTFRGMRRSLMKIFRGLRFLDLHGNSKKKEKSPGGDADENVFDIQQGVAILIGHRNTLDTLPQSVLHANLWGRRMEKYSQLATQSYATTSFSRLIPTAPYFLFVPQDTSLRSEYEPFPSITEILPVNNMGVTTGNDDRYVAFSTRELAERFNGSEKTHKFVYRPFDTRFLNYDPSELARARVDFMRNMLDQKNLALITIRRPRNDKVANFFVSDSLTDKCFISSLDNSQVLPLYVLPVPSMLGFSKEAVPNIGPSFLKQLASTLNLKLSDHGLPAGLTPEDIFHYAYAVFHSPDYRSRYAEFLKIDFPRLPLTRNLKLFHALHRLGGVLTALHLLESPTLDKPITEFIGGRNSEVEKISWSRNTVWVNKAQTTGFQGVCEDVWNFHIGGYQVCEKWLKDRKGRELTSDNIVHYQRIVVALSETIRLMAEIDKVIDAHGGWPGAFQSADAGKGAA